MASLLTKSELYELTQLQDIVNNLFGQNRTMRMLSFLIAKENRCSYESQLYRRYMFLYVRNINL